jgi:hypothetical protein
VPEVRAFPPPFPREKSYQHGGITSGRSPSPLKPPKLATISLKLEANHTHTHTHTHTPCLRWFWTGRVSSPLATPSPTPSPRVTHHPCCPRLPAPGSLRWSETAGTLGWAGQRGVSKPRLHSPAPLPLRSAGRGRDAARQRRAGALAGSNPAG